MHTPNHLTSPTMAIVGGVVAIALIAVAISKASKQDSTREKLPLVGALGAFIFACQMFNFPLATIGCSGHLVGGVLLAALLGPWLGFLTLAGVLTLQSLLFADGGLLTLGWNIVNMAAIGALVVYPLLFRPIARGSGASPARLFVASLVSSTVAIALGATAVVIESALSNISALPMATFFANMLPIHLLIGLCEGAITGLVVAIVAKREPTTLELYYTPTKHLRANFGGTYSTFAICALLIGGVLTLVASESPDGMNWAIERTLEGGSIAPSALHHNVELLQSSIAIAPDYQGNYTGLIATAAILLFGWVATSPSRKKAPQKNKAS